MNEMNFIFKFVGSNTGSSVINLPAENNKPLGTSGGRAQDVLHRGDIPGTPVNPVMTGGDAGIPLVNQPNINTGTTDTFYPGL